MSTAETTQLRWLAEEWERLYKSAVCSGIVGDPAHRRQGGYHISRVDNPKGNYSVVRPDDKKGPSDRAAAIDMSMSTPDMKLCTSRLRAAFAHKGDPRRVFLNAFNGWLGTGAAQRFDIFSDVVCEATADHKWHVHLEVRRAYVANDVAMRAVRSILAGETIAQWEGADMEPGELANLLNDPKVAGILHASPWRYTGRGIPTGKSTLGVLNDTHLAVNKLSELVAAVVAEQSKIRAQQEAVMALVQELVSVQRPPSGGQ